MFSARKLYTVCSVVLAWAHSCQPFLPASGLKAYAAFSCNVASRAGLALAGLKVGRHLSKEKAIVATFSSLIALFFVVAVHPFADAPMDLSLDSSRHGVIAEPICYAGAYNDKEYFATKRVEVRISLESVAVGRRDFVLAGHRGTIP